MTAASCWHPATTIHSWDRTRCSPSRHRPTAPTRSGSARAPTAVTTAASICSTWEGFPCRIWPGRRGAHPAPKWRSSGWAIRPVPSEQRSCCRSRATTPGWRRCGPSGMAWPRPSACHSASPPWRSHRRPSRTTSQPRPAAFWRRRTSSAAWTLRMMSTGSASRHRRDHRGGSGAGAVGSARRSIWSSTFTATTRNGRNSRAMTMPTAPTARRMSRRPTRARSSSA